MLLGARRPPEVSAMPATRHPFLDLVLPNALAPQLQHGPDHSHDPRPPDTMLEDILAQFGPHPALPALAMLLAADHDCRADHYKAALTQLGLAETRLRLDLPATAPALQAALGAIAMASEEAARRDCGRACAAIATAIRAALQYRAAH
jgi:hypothetical protein